jgi:hypothetical protein
VVGTVTSSIRSRFGDGRKTFSKSPSKISEVNSPKTNRRLDKNRSAEKQSPDRRRASSVRISTPPTRRNSLRGLQGGWIASRTGRGPARNDERVGADARCRHRQRLAPLSERSGAETCCRQRASQRLRDVKPHVLAHFDPSKRLRTFQRLREPGAARRGPLPTEQLERRVRDRASRLKEAYEELRASVAHA